VFALLIVLGVCVNETAAGCALFSRGFVAAFTGVNGGVAGGLAGNQITAFSTRAGGTLSKAVCDGQVSNHAS